MEFNIETEYSVTMSYSSATWIKNGINISVFFTSSNKLQYTKIFHTSPYPN